MPEQQKYFQDASFEQLPVSVRGHKPKNDKEEKYLREVLEFEFANLEEPGLMHTFTYGDTKHKRRFTFMHGGKYNVPRFIARHVESAGKPIWKWKPDGSGSMMKEYGGNTPRFRMTQVF